MTANKEQITRSLQEEMEELAKQRELEEIRKKEEFNNQQIEDEKKRIRNALMDQLNSRRQERAREVLAELMQRNIKKVGNDRVDMLSKREDDLDYDTIMSFFQNVLRREREAFEIQKNKKVNDIEIWSRAIKEEECLAM